ncbi:hypothetical protein FHS42_001849 [Streptomyces zagrosensis]|uniref:Uncharacterized protein n=1 Tax=Streptomyces zagrosensis TaxID=1042984 RepID=A0A7W9UXM4_9ACTN|nr:hypothetical protein [Streptomyces zagrosensis]
MGEPGRTTEAVEAAGICVMAERLAIDISVKVKSVRKDGRV